MKRGEGRRMKREKEGEMRRCRGKEEGAREERVGRGRFRTTDILRGIVISVGLGHVLGGNGPTYVRT